MRISVAARCSSGPGQLRPVTGVPAAVTRVTDEQLDGYATVYIDRGLWGEHAAAHPASGDQVSHGSFVFSMNVHAFSLRPTEGESTIRKDPRGDLTGAAGEEFRRAGLKLWESREKG